MNKKYFLLTVLVITSLSIQTFADSSKEDADLLIQKMWNSFVDGDLKAFSETMAKDKNMITFGTDASERWDGWNELEDSVDLQFKTCNVKKSTREHNLVGNSIGM